MNNFLQHQTILGAHGLVPGGGGGGGQQTTGGTTSSVGYNNPAPQNEPAPMTSMIFTILPFVAVFIGMWFLMIRPHKKREKQMKEMQSTIKAGDNVVTSSGLFGRVADVGTDCFVVELGISGRTVKIPVLKSDVIGVREPVLTPPHKEVVEG